MKTQSKSIQIFLFAILISGLQPVVAFAKSKTKAAYKIIIVLPVDTAVKIGKLPNGFTYYIRHNEEPKNRVTIYLVNKVGSILETEEQCGLAHFLEHMAFNGTKHFPKNELVSYLQKSGVKFGGDLNAFTSFDETVYQLPLPTDNPELLKNGFQIMRDWAQDATLDSIEIEKERGVILEEKRLNSNAQQRLRDQFFPIITNNSRYSKRLPIGTDEVLTGFKHTTLRDFYKWYRPNLQALVVVGNIDVAETEKTIEAMFSDLKNPVPAPEHPEFKILLNGKNQFYSTTDKEVQMPTIQMLGKFEKEKLVTREDYKQNIIRTLLNFIMSERFSDLSKQPNSPYVQAGSSVSGLVANIDAFSTSIVAESSKLENAVKTVWTEVIRLKKYGVTGNELTRAKNEYLKRKESGYNERSKTRSGSYVNKYMNHFLKGEAPLDIEFEYPMSKELTSEITTKDISASIAKYISKTNRDILVTAPEKDKDALPKEADFNRWMKEVESSKIAANQDNKNNKTLLATKPAPGKIVNTTTNSAIGTTEFTLSNGVKVVLKPTDFKNDEISFTAFSPGGTSLYKDNEYESADAATGVTTSAGLGDFTLSELQKHLTGKRMNVKPYIGERYEGFSGSAAPDDLETALQLVYLYFTQPRKDFSVITGELERAKVSIANRGNDPSTVFSDSVSAILSNYNIRRTAPSIEKLNAIDFNRSYDIYKERFADAGDFTFTFVGNFDVEKIKPLLEQYLGALPAINRIEEARNLGIQTPAGKIDRKVYKGIDNKSSVRLVYSGSYNYSETENYKLNALADLLTIKLIERLREDEGGVYGVSASANYSKFPKNRYSVNISFGCAPTNVEKLISAVQEVIEKVKTELPQALDIEKIVNEDLRSMELQLKTNGFWLSYLVGKQQTGDNLLSVLDYKEKLKKITPEALQSAAREYLTGENFIRIVLYPEKKQ